MTARELLDESAIQATANALRAAFSAVATIKATMPGGPHVQFPNIPSILSESIVAAEIRNGRAPPWDGRRDVARGRPAVGGDVDTMGISAS